MENIGRKKLTPARWLFLTLLDLILQCFLDGDDGVHKLVMLRLKLLLEIRFQRIEERNEL